MDFRKYLIIIISVTVLLVTVLLFRGKMVSLLSFNLGEKDLFELEKKDNSATTTSEQESSLNEKVQVKKEKDTKLVVLTEPASKKALPLYTGRDPAEFRPVPEEVRVFTEEQIKQLNATIQTHARVVKSDSTYFNGWIQIGILKKMIGDFEGARDAWEYVSLIQPGNSLSYANLGELYWRYLHDYPNSEKNLLISIKNKPDDFQTYVTLSELYYYSYQEKYDLAEKVLLDGITSNLDNFSVKVNLTKALAALYRRRQEFSKAVTELEKVLAMEPENAEVASAIEALQKKINP